MSNLKFAHTDDDILQIAYRMVCSWLNESIGLMSKAIPRTPDPNRLSAVQTQALVQEYDSEIQRFKDAVSGKIKPPILQTDIEPKEAMTGRNRKQTHQRDIETLRQAIVILKKRRKPYAHKLFMARINQYKLSGITSKTEQVHQEAQKILQEIHEYQTRIRTAVGRHEQLQTEFNDAYNKFTNTNLDPTRRNALIGPERLPNSILDFTKATIKPQTQQETPTTPE